MGLDFATWPDVPQEQRPLKLFVNDSVKPEQVALLEARGWVVKDVRLMEGAEAIRATLQGLAVGSIRDTTVNPKILELAGKAQQVFSGEGPDKQKQKLVEGETLRELLSFTNVQRGVVPAALVPKPHYGRPKGSKDTVKRQIDPTKKKLVGAALKAKLDANARKAILEASKQEEEK